MLELVTKGGVRSYADLAQELRVSEELLEQVMQHLARIGYLRPVAGSCQAQCAGCPLGNTCALGRQTRVWALTEKGLLAAERLSTPDPHHVME